MKYLWFRITLYTLLPTLCIAQAPDTVWTRTFGGTDSDGGFSVHQTSDGGYVVVGGTWSFGAGGDDVYLIRTDSLGNTLWTKTYGGAYMDVGSSVQQTSDGGYIIAGWTAHSSFDVDFFLIKTDEDGDTLWTRVYGVTGDDRGFSVAQTSDAGYIVTGYCLTPGNEFDVYVVKTNAFGDTLWTKTYGGVLWDEGYSVGQTNDNGYIIVGDTESFGAGGDDVWLIKTDSLGDTLWTKTHGVAGTDVAHAVQQTIDGGYIIAGGAPANGIFDLWLIKTDSFGDTLWTKTYGEIPWDEGYAVQQTDNGGYIVTGYTGSFGAGGYDVWLIRTNIYGDSLWTKTFGGSEDDKGRSVQQTSDGGYIIAGSTRSFGAGSWDVWLLKIAPDTFSIVEKKPAHIDDHRWRTTIFNGPLILPAGKNCKVFDITGTVVMPDKIKPGIYFIEVDGRITRKVIKVR